MLVRLFMARAVVTLDVTTGCRAALDTLHLNRIRRAPVVRHGALVGMISEKDLLRVLAGTAGMLDTDAGADAERAPIGTAMATRVVTLDPEEHLEDAARKMLEHKIGGLPVVQGGEIVGMLTESDVFRAFTAMAESRGLLRVSLSGGKHADLERDPVRIALALGFRIRGFLLHARRGGQDLAVLRVRGERKDDLVERLTVAGFHVLEIVDARDDPPEPAVA